MRKLQHPLIFGPEFFCLPRFLFTKTQNKHKHSTLPVVSYGRETNVTSDIKGRIPNDDVSEYGVEEQME
jgi:hypothetical protein